MEAGVLLVVAAVAIGFAIGIFSGMLGIGGGTVMVPVLRVLFGLDAVVSTATSLFAIIPTSISGAVAHLRNRTCVPKLGLALGLGGACMSPVGVWLGHHSPSWLVMLVAAAVICYSAVTMLRKAFRSAVLTNRGQAAAAASPSTQSSRDLGPSRTGVRVGSELPRISGTGETLAGVPGEPAGLSSGEPSLAATPPAGTENRGQAGTGETLAAPPESPNLSWRDLLKGFAIGLAAGVVSGYIGVGGGFIMVPLMLQVLRVPMKLASGTSLEAVLILAIPGTIAQGLAGSINFAAGIALAAGAIPGAVVGAQLVRRVNERTLRLLFGCFLMVAAVLLLVKEAGLI